MKEMKAHKKNGTWEIVHLPRDKKTVQCKWLFMVKCEADGKIEKMLDLWQRDLHKHKPME